MLKKSFLFFAVVALLVSGCSQRTTKSVATLPDNKITLKGSVKFDDPKFKMQVFKREGFDKKIIAEFDINPDGTYEYELEVTEPGKYTLNCKQWEMIDFWAENEDIEVHFRGMDTAKMKIKNPKYYYIENSGPLNEVMNHFNYVTHRNYQLMIGLGQAAYRADISDKAKGALSGTFYGLLNTDIKDRVTHLAHMYADRNSVLAIIPMLSDKDPIQAAAKAKILSTFETRNPNFAPYVKYKKADEEARYQRERLNIGKPAPDFTYPDINGKEVSLSDFKGKVVLIDFWASWCGPCIGEFPHLKKVYAKYKSQGLEILGVSIDKKEDAWRKAVKDNDLKWTLLLASNSGKEIMKEYQFSGIPYILIIDREGRIAYKGLRGENIDKAIKDVLSK